MLGFKKRRTAPTSAKVYREKVKKHAPSTSLLVLRAVYMIGQPCNGRMVETELRWRGGSITPRLAELEHRGLILEAYKKRGLDGIWRKCYMIAPEGYKRLEEAGLI